jgi:hypothetical protein
MRELIRHLVARKGGERLAVRAVDISQQLLRKSDRADRVHAPGGNESIGASIAAGDRATDSLITIIYDRENFPATTHATVAGAIPGFGLLD